MGMKVEAVDKRNPMLIRVATVVDTEDHRLKVRLDRCPIGLQLPLSPAPHLNSLVAPRSISMAGVQSMTTGWRLTARTCTPLDGVRKPGTRCNTQMVRNIHQPQQLLRFILLIVGGIYNQLRLEWLCSRFHCFVCVWVSGSSDPPTAPGQGCPTPGCNGVGHIRGPRYGTHYTSVTYLLPVEILCFTCRLFYFL